MKRNRVGVDLDDELYGRVAEEAERLGVPLAFVVRAIVKRHYTGDEHETKTNLTIRMLREHASNDRIAEALEEQFGEASRASISWHRSNLRKQGEDVPSDAEAKEDERMAAFDASVAKGRAPRS